uniref:Uncharacterized protein n=1 Tax=Magallana gigas TaxID=29159 RepID=K1QBD6_MAGGI
MNNTCVWMNNNQPDYHKSWSTDNCNVRKGYVCKRPEDNNRTGPWMWTNADGNGYWRTTTNCVAQKAFVCQIPMGKQVKPVTTPRPQFKCDGHWVLFNGNCYQFNDTKLTWLNARTTCQGMGADLVTINSANTQSFVQSNIMR